MNSGASSSSSVSRSPLAKASRKRRASALLLSSDDTGASSSLLLPNPVSLAGRHHEYDATRSDQAHRLGLIHRSDPWPSPGHPEAMKMEPRPRLFSLREYEWRLTSGRS